MSQSVGDPDAYIGGMLQAKHIVDAMNLLADAANIVLDVSRGDLFQVVLAGNRNVSAPTGTIAPGQVIAINVIQDAVGGRTLTWDAAFKQSWSDTGNTLGKQCWISFRFNGVNWVQLGQGPYV